MAKQTINLGSSPNKGDGDPLRTSLTKVNENFDEVYAEVAILKDDGVVDLVGQVNVNSAKIGITSVQASDIVANNTKVGITSDQADQIVVNNAKTGITTQQADQIVVNNAKTGITTQQASDITTNNAKTGITTQQADQIVVNNAKLGVTTQQASDITANNAKTGITTQQASDITTNNAKTGITTQQASDITTNNAKTIPSNVSDLTNDSGYLSNAIIPGVNQNDSISLESTVDPTMTVHLDITTGEVAIGVATNSTGTGTGALQVTNGGAYIDQDVVVGGTVRAVSLRTSEAEIALGGDAGLTNQGSTAIAIGSESGLTNQGESGLAIGYGAGQDDQGEESVAIGLEAGYEFQSNYAIGIGSYAGWSYQGNESVALGYSAGEYYQGARGTAIGNLAGRYQQGPGSVAIGNGAGVGTEINATYTSGGTGGSVIVEMVDTTGIYVSAVLSANGFSQGQSVVSVNSSTQLEISASADTTPTSGNPIRFRRGQSLNSVALGTIAGSEDQGEAAIAIGANAGRTSQGLASVAIGLGAGEQDQASNSIIINATGAALNNTVEDTLVIQPIRSAALTTILGYNATSGEVTHSATIPGYTDTVDLKALVAASADFADFQTRMAAL